MRDEKRNEKENNIIAAAERVFSEVGFKNAKMEDIATEANITKVTLYSYFHSKENLYLAITYKAVTKLNDIYYEIVDKNKVKNGLRSVMDLLTAFMDFCQDNYLYSEALLEYFALVRSTNDGRNLLKLTEATKESIYFVKLQDVQNLAFKITAKEIQRGQSDGSIVSNIDPMMYTLYGWASIIGYIKVLAASGNNANPLFNVNLQELKQLNLKLVNMALGSNTMQDTMNAMEEIGK